MRLTALAMLCLAGCSQPGQDGQKFRLEGECDPPSQSKAVTPVRGVNYRCEGSQVPEVFQVDSQAQLDDALGALCHIDAPVDFTQQQVLLVRGYPTGVGLSAGVHFLSDDPAARTIGLYYRPTGFPLPDTAMIVPRTTLPLKIQSCREVCVSDCDRAIP
jgi:hypothetical protein